MSQSDKPKRKYTRRAGLVSADRHPAITPERSMIEPPAQRRQYISVPTVVDPGVPCRHCGALYGHHVKHTYSNGNRRRLCGKCGKPFVTVRRAEK